ncbi:hypothetical protein QJK98_20030, partial [Clostridioides difficile]|nr:hypothetical protein [Clostridioides difficile]MDI2913313.1 hypothetical protein [Clostridioides difficile]MDI2976488.1 hypothetical protein [Clostridioides difficile]MDS6353144.1 hypothetical protein [Clostridioides difficile]
RIKKLEGAHMTNKEMCKSNNLDEREVCKEFGKEICGRCINDRRDCESKDCDATYENWLEKEIVNYV